MTALGALVLPEHDGQDGAELFRRAEELGFDHAWSLDHLCWPPLRDEPWYDVMITLAAAACHTTRITLGTLVTSPNFRHPVLVAKQAMALDRLSEGRFVLGVGAGAAGPDSSALGGEPPTAGARADRFEEFVATADQLLRRPRTTLEGSYFSAHDVRMTPGCLTRPRLPLAVAASGPRGMRLAAATAEYWVTIGDPGAPGRQREEDAFATLRRQCARLTEACERAGRSPGTLRRLVNLSRVTADPYSSPERLAELVGRCAELGFTDVVIAWPRAEGVFAGDLSAFERAVAHLRGIAPATRPTGSRTEGTG